MEQETLGGFNPSLQLKTTRCNPGGVGAVISFYVPYLFFLIGTETFLKLHFNPFFGSFSLILYFTSR